MSTTISGAPRRNDFYCRHDSHRVLSNLELQRSLFDPEQLQQRLVALDNLDAEFGGFHSELLTSHADSRVYGRARALRARLEAANVELYQSIRSDILRGSQPRTLLEWIQDSRSQNGSGSLLPGLGFDWRDELASGILQFREPSEPDVHRSPEMVPYQPTPVRHILQLIAVNKFSENDLFVDLGSGLGHVPLLVSMLTGVQSLGIEVQSAYVASAQECAQSLCLSCVRFVPEDVRAIDLSNGTVFYLYSPFTGSILTDVLGALRTESTRRRIKMCSLGPCTDTLAKERWLRVNTPPDRGRITVFESR